MRCRKVRKLIEAMPKEVGEERQRLVSDHLSECEACRRLHAGLQKVDEVLAGSKVWLDEVACVSRMSKSRIRARMVSREETRRWRLRPLWAGAAAILIVVIAGFSVLFLFPRGGDKETRNDIELSAPGVTQAKMAEASSQTLDGFAEAVSRYEAPSLDLSYKRPVLPRDSYVPRVLQESRLQSGNTLRTIAESSTRLLRRSEL